MPVFEVAGTSRGDRDHTVWGTCAKAQPHGMSWQVCTSDVLKITSKQHLVAASQWVRNSGDVAHHVSPNIAKLGVEWQRTTPKRRSHGVRWCSRRL